MLEGAATPPMAGHSLDAAFASACCIGKAPSESSGTVPESQTPEASETSVLPADDGSSGPFQAPG